MNSSNEGKIPPSYGGTEIGESQATKVRDDRIDAVKYWLIVLVIAAHVLERKEFADSTICPVLFKWIIIFCMPLFIFISGYFSRKKDMVDLWPSIWKLLEPLIIYQVILKLIPHILFKGTDNFVNAIFTPWWVLWYLLSLIYWRLILQIIPNKILKHTKLVIICAFCISILAGFLPFDRFLSLQRTLALMPFFFLGYYMRGKSLYFPDKYKPHCFIFLIVMFAIPFLIPQYLGDFHHAYPYVNAYVAVKRMFVFALAIPMSIAFLNVCYNTPWIARQGRLSMQYYIYHSLMIKPLIMIGDKLNIPMSFVTATIITVGIILGISFALKISYIKMLTNPSLFFIRNNLKK